ncbi:MAG: copper chaperone PCu(A)C [Alphaproteobacteria bacterium]|nr:copper chaperone PCu(A)C [Alphaproteobacteria bacterium]
MSRRSLLLSALLLAILAPPAARAAEYRTGALRVEAPTMPATLKGARNGAGYLVIHNEGPAADRLVRAESGAARAVELHTHIRDGEIVRMRPVEAIELPPGAAVRLAPGGQHLMFLGLARPFAAGEKVAVTLVFERAGRLEIELAVTALRPAAGHGHH